MKIDPWPGAVITGRVMLEGVWLNVSTVVHCLETRENGAPSVRTRWDMLKKTSTRALVHDWKFYLEYRPTRLEFLARLADATGERFTDLYNLYDQDVEGLIAYAESL